MPRRLRLFSPVALSAAAALALTACAPAAEEPASPSVEVADTPVGAKTSWILDVLAAEEDTTAEEWEAHLDTSFTAEVSAADVAELLNTQIRPAGPFTVTAYQGDDRSAVTTLEGTVGDPLDMTVSINADDKILGFLLAPAAAPWRASTSLDEVAQRLDALPGDVGVLIRRVGADGADEELVERRADEAAPLGSVFKLFVLLATAEAVRSSELTWDDTLVLTDADRSLPSGRLQDQPTGTEVSVRDAAQEMIAISDNTATDLLIRRLGRERIEGAFASVGGEGNVPWLTTKDFFTLGWGDPSLAAQWSDADEAERRSLVESIDSAPLTVEATAVTSPVWNTGVDWFASPTTVAAVHGALLETGDETVRVILSKNPGVDADLDRTLLPYLGFKGGSAPGVLAASWTGETAKGDRVTVVIQLRGDDPAAITGAQRDVFGLGADALRLAAEGDGQR